MKISPYFHDLRSAYQAELDDLLSDSEGKDVLRKRLAEKRDEIVFLVQMMDLAPEMVAVVFHHGFRFTKPAAIERVLGLSVDDLPDWQEIAHAVALEPWAQDLAEIVLSEPQGAQFLTVAAGLEYLQLHSRMAANAASALHADGGHGADDAADGEDALEHDDDFDMLSADDAADPKNSRTRDEASSNWLSDVGFDRKD